MSEPWTIPPIMTKTGWNAMLDHSFEKEPSYIIRKNGTYYEAIKGGTSSGAGMITYGGSGNAGGISGTDAVAVFEAVEGAMSSGGTAIVKRATYTFTSTFDITTSDQRWIFEPGTTITYTGVTIAIRLGLTPSWTTGTRLFGNQTLITRSSSGGTYGIYMDEAHVCELNGFKVSNFTTGIGVDASWGSQIRNYEVYGTAGNTGVDTGIYLITRNNLFLIEDSWIQGDTVGILLDGTENQSIHIVRTCLHNVPRGFMLDPDCDCCHDLTFEQCYMGEGITNEVIYLDNGDDSDGEEIASNVHVINNFIWVNDVGVWCNDVHVIQIGGNTVEGTGTFVNTPVDTNNRLIYMTPTNRGPWWAATEYGGCDESLIQLDTNDATVSITGGIRKIVLQNQLGRLYFVDSTGGVQDVMYYGSDDILRIYNDIDDIYITAKQNDATKHMLVGLDFTGEIWLGYHTGGSALPSKIVLQPDPTTGVIELRGSKVSLQTDIIPETDNAADIGDATHELKDIYVDGKAYIDELGENLLIGGFDIGSVASQIGDTWVDGTAYIDTLNIEVALNVDAIDINATSLGSVTAVIPVTSEGGTGYIAIYDGYS